MSRLDDLESSIKEAEFLPADDIASLENLSGKHYRALSRLASSNPLPDPDKIHVWNLSHRLWNAFAAARPELRQIAAELLLLAGSPAEVSSPGSKPISFFRNTGMIWKDLGQFDLAAACFDWATDLTSAQIAGISRSGDEEEKHLVQVLNIARMTGAWETRNWSLLQDLHGRSKKMLFGSPAAHKALAELYLNFGAQLVSWVVSPNSAPSAYILLIEAMDLCDSGIAESPLIGGSGEIPVLRGLKDRCRQFLIADRLQ